MMKSRDCTVISRVLLRNTDKDFMRFTSATFQMSKDNKLNIKRWRSREILAEIRQNMNEKEILFKVLIVGDAEVGKTSFVRRYVFSAYERSYKPTLGVDFALKVIPWSETQTVRLQLWDIAGQERFTSMTRVYYRRASACLILFDVTQPNSFHNAVKWKKDLDSKCFNSSGENIPCVLVANKIDLPVKVEKAEINDLCKEHKFLGWTEMSVKDDKHVTETMEFLVAELMSPSTPVPTEETGYIGPTMPDPDDRKKSCCGS